MVELRNAKDYMKSVERFDDYRGHSHHLDTFPVPTTCLVDTHSCHYLLLFFIICSFQCKYADSAIPIHPLRATGLHTSCVAV